MSPVKSTYTFEKYTAVIPHITNVYGPEKDRLNNWQFGFKYANGVFEYWPFITEEAAQTQYDKLLAAIEAYWQYAGGRKVEHTVSEISG